VTSGDDATTDRYAVAADGTRLAFDVVGSGEPLVLLAGQANARGWWTPVRDDFAAGYRTIALDYPGTGGSDQAGADGWSTRRFAADVVAVLDELGVPRAHVYGTSMGGRTAQWLAIDHPDRVAALLLGCTTGGGAGNVPPAPEVSARLAAGPQAARAELERTMVSPSWWATNPGPLPVLGDPTMTESARRGHRLASIRHDAWDELPGIRAATLVLHGTADELTPPANGQLLAGRIPGARLSLLGGARHAYFLERRDQASPIALRFLAEHPLPSATG
jgi:3-oxoadipate enol-lactonase